VSHRCHQVDPLNWPAQVSEKVTELETSLAMLEAKLRSVPELQQRMAAGMAPVAPAAPVVSALPERVRPPRRFTPPWCQMPASLPPSRAQADPRTYANG
jgi:hypothetical protein